MKTTIDMSAQAVTNRMTALDQLWELAVALKSSKIIEDDPVEKPSAKSATNQSQKSEE